MANNSSGLWQSVELGRSVNDLSKRLFPFLELPHLGQPHTLQLPLVENAGNKQVKKSLAAQGSQYPFHLLVVPNSKECIF